MRTILLCVVAVALATGCYRSHEREELAAPDDAYVTDIPVLDVEVELPDLRPLCEEDPADFCCCDGDVVAPVLCGEEQHLICPGERYQRFPIEICGQLCGPCSFPCDAGASVQDAG